MEKEKLYRDRIIWRAGQNSLLSMRCSEFSDLPSEKSREILEKLPHSEELVLAFWDSESKWTALGVKSIYSYFDGSLTSARLDDIKKKLSVYWPSGEAPANHKEKACFVSLDAANVIVWAPAGSECYALMNILLMFPLGSECEGGACGKDVPQGSA